MNIAMVDMIKQPQITNKITPVGQCIKDETVGKSLERVIQNGTNISIYDDTVDEDIRANETSTDIASVYDKKKINYSLERYLLTKLKVSLVRSNHD